MSLSEPARTIEPNQPWMVEFAKLVSRHGACRPAEDFVGQSARTSAVMSSWDFNRRGGVDAMMVMDAANQLARGVPAGCAGCSYMRLRAETEMDHMRGAQKIHMDATCAAPYSRACPRTTSTVSVPTSKIAAGLADLAASGFTSTEDWGRTPSFRLMPKPAPDPDPVFDNEDLIAQATQFLARNLKGDFRAAAGIPAQEEPTSSPKTKPALVW